MTGASSGDAEDLLGQFLAHRAAPTQPRPTPATAPETPEEPDEPTDERADERTDEAIEESVDGPVYELADAPLDFSDSEPEPAVADTMAHAGAVLEAFAAGTLEVTPDATLDDALYEVAPDVPDLEVDPVPPATTAQASPSGANEASRAVLAAFLGTSAPEQPAAAESLALSEGAAVLPPPPEPEPDLLLTTESEAEPEAPAAEPDEVAAFEELAVSSPLSRTSSSTTDHRARGPVAEPDDRPDATAASATVFAAFQDQLAGRRGAVEDRFEPEPAPRSHAGPTPAEPEIRPVAEPVARPVDEPVARPVVEPVARPGVEPVREPVAEPAAHEPEANTPIAPPTTRAKAPKPARHRPPKAEARVTAPRLPAAPAPEPEPDRPALPHEIEFKPRRMARALVALILLVFVAASAIACWWAYRDRTLVPVGIAATVLIATGIVWATRAGSTVAHLSVKGGRLEITKDGTRTVFDLTSQYTDIDVQGTPGRRNWRVLFGRRGLPPFVVDATMVSPTEFMRVLDHYRPPESRPGSR